MFSAKKKNRNRDQGSNLRWSEVVWEIRGQGLFQEWESRYQGSNMGPLGGRDRALPVGSVPNTPGKQATSPLSDHISICVLVNIVKFVSL